MSSIEDSLSLALSMCCSIRSILPFYSTTCEHTFRLPPLPLSVVSADWQHLFRPLCISQRCSRQEPRHCPGQSPNSNCGVRCPGSHRYPWKQQQKPQPNTQQRSSHSQCRSCCCCCYCYLRAHHSGAQQQSNIGSQSRAWEGREDLGREGQELG